MQEITQEEQTKITQVLLEHFKKNLKPYQKKQKRFYNQYPINYSALNLKVDLP